MLLEITNNKDYFKIIGNLNEDNLHIFENTFQNIFEKLDRIVINIEGLNKIDRSGVQAIANLHNQSILKKKKLSLIGLINPDKYNSLDQNDAA